VTGGDTRHVVKEGMPEHRNEGTPEYHFHFEGKFKKNISNP
jgi:hypothetical protein